MADIGAEAAGIQLHRLAVGGMVSQAAGRRAGLGLDTGQQFDGAVHANLQHVVVAPKGFVGRPMFEIGTEFADAGGDGLAVLGMGAQQARQGQQGQGLGQGQLAGLQALVQAGAFRLAFLVFRFAQLDVMAIGALFQQDRQPGFRVGAQFLGAVGCLFRGAAGIDGDGQRPGVFAFRVVGATDEGTEFPQFQAQPAGAAGRAHPGIVARAVRRKEMRPQFLVQGFQNLGDPQGLGVIHRRREFAPELVQHAAPFDTAAGNIIQLVFQVGGEIVLDVAVEEIFQEGGDHPAAVLGHKTAVLEAHIVPFLQHGNDRGIGGRPADTQFLQLFHQAGFGITGRRLGEVLAVAHRLAVHGLVFRHLGQQALGVVVRGIVAVFAIDGQKAGELDHRAGGAEPDGGVRRDDIDPHLVQQGAFHLAGDGAPPDQLVQLQLLAVEMARHVGRPAEDIGGTDRLMGFLGVFRLGLVNAGTGRQIPLAVVLLDQGAGGADGLGGHLYAIGSHIGDQTHSLAADIDALVKALGDLHGAGGRQIQFARRLLLQGRGGERRIGVTLGLFLFHRPDMEGGGQHLGLGGFRRGLVTDVEFVELPAVQDVQRGADLRLAGRQEIGLQGPVFLAAEPFDLGFPLADQAQRHRLHPSGRAAARQFAPQDRRQGEAHQIIQGPAGQIGVHQFLVQVAGVAHGLDHRAFGDLVEHHPLDIDPLERLAVLEDAPDMPGNGLSLAVRVGGQDQALRAFDGGNDFTDVFFRLGVGFPVHGEAVIRTDRAVLRRQITDMSVAGDDMIVLPQVLVDGLGLGR